jgi:hypothetical protein
MRSFTQERRVTMKGLTQVSVLSSTWNEMRVLGLRADGALFRGHITVKAQTGAGGGASVIWTPVTEAEDAPVSEAPSPKMGLPTGV